MLATKKPVTIEYLPFTRENHEAILKWSTTERPINIATPRCINGKAIAQITTLEGVYTATEEQDVIIKGVQGEVYPCKLDIFNQTYTTIQETPTVLPGKTVIQKFANWLAAVEGKENFELTASDTAIVIRRV